MRVASVGQALPPNAYDQEQLLDRLREKWAGRYHNVARIEQLHRNVLVGVRHLALPAEEYRTLDTFGKANDAWIRVAQEVGGRAVLAAVAKAGLSVREIDAFYSATVTGLGVPSIEARLINRLEMRPDVRRVPIFGLGCVAGAAGISLVADYLKAWPEQAALLLSVELCSLTLQSEDLSIPNLIASGLFGDGAAAVVMLGAEHPGAAQAIGPQIVGTRSVFYPGTERVMGWDISEHGFKVVLSAEVPDVVRKHVRRDVDDFLASHALTLGDISSWVCHPGGPKVLEAMEEALQLGPEALALTWKSLREVGNLSSSSVLFVLGDTMAHRRPSPGSFGVLLAMGPGFCLELVLLRW